MTRLRQAFALQQLAVDADDEHFLVVGAVEHADASALGQPDRGAPQEIVIELLGRRRLEREDLDALRVDAGKDMLDRAVLSRRVHGLEDQQHTPLVLGVEGLLKRRDALNRLPEQRLGFLLRRRKPLRVGGVDVVETKILAFGDGEPRRQLDEPMVCHVSAPPIPCPAGAQRRIAAAPGCPQPGCAGARRPGPEGGQGKKASKTHVFRGIGSSPVRNRRNLTLRRGPAGGSGPGRGSSPHLFSQMAHQLN